MGNDFNASPFPPLPPPLPSERCGISRFLEALETIYALETMDALEMLEALE